ncbi:MAG: UMP kinase [Planctomycetota bacterium]
MPRYARVMLKLSGEVLGGEAGAGLDPTALGRLATELKAVTEQGVELAVVVGGGNILRGAENGLGIERATADYMGMLATIINAVALQGAVEAQGQPCRVLSAIETREVCEPFIRRRAIRHMEKRRVVILAGGTGNPFFTTDTAAALRASELQCEVLLKATKVDGVYSSDPRKDPSARRYERITFEECLRKNLRVMDQTAFSLCRENRLPIIVFSIQEPGNILRAVQGEANLGTHVLAE